MTPPRDAARFAVVGALLLGMGSVLYGSQRDRDRLADDLTVAQERIDELATGFAVVSGQVESLGGEPAVELEHTDDGPRPVEVPGPPGPPGPAPSAAAVRSAVERYCAANGCTGPQGPAPSASQVAAAVAAYCDGRGECRGQAGASGAAGADGDPGAAGPQGEEGPPPSDTQVASAVASYCAAHDGCAGPAGPTGPQGPAGEQGGEGPPGPAPESWTFDWLGTTWTCVDPDGDRAYECTST